MRIKKLIQTEKEFKKFHTNSDFQHSIRLLKSIEPELEYEDEEQVEEQILKNVDSWVYHCLEDAKYIIRKHHTDYDTAEFFSNTTYRLFPQTDIPSAYAYIHLEPNSNHFKIGIHEILLERNPQNERMLVIILVHELLHAIHDREGWGHDKINPLETKLANLAGYFDALIEMENLAISGRMHFCNE